MKSKLVVYGQFNSKSGVQYAVASIDYEEIYKRDIVTNEIKIVGERIINVYNVRGSLEYMRKYGVTRCLRYSTLQSLVNNDIELYSNLGFKAIEPYNL